MKVTPIIAALPRAPGAALVLCCALVALPVWAQFAAPEDPQQAQAERARISAERRAVEVGFATEQKQCYQRFAVNDCLRESRAKRRWALSALRRQEVVLNDAERKRKATEQQRKIELKAQERAQRVTPPQSATSQPPAPTGRAGSARSQSTPQLADPRTSPKPPIAPQRTQRSSSAEQRRADNAAARAEQARDAEAKEQRHEEKLREAAEHKAKVLRDNAAMKKPAAPLPSVAPGAPGANSSGTPVN